MEAQAEVVVAAGEDHGKVNFLYKRRPPSTFGLPPWLKLRRTGRRVKAVVGEAAIGELNYTGPPNLAVRLLSNIRTRLTGRLLAGIRNSNPDLRSGKNF